MRLRAELFLLSIALGGCTVIPGIGGGGADRPVTNPVPPPVTSGPVLSGSVVSDSPVKIGKPYEIGGVTYTPVDQPSYDAVGYASWYGEAFHQAATANGERFDQGWFTAAHQTLPLPSYVEVTALDTGKTILVRVNDRGPFAANRMLDLSRRAADELGVTGQGVAKVRVRRVYPAEADRMALRSGRQPAPRANATPQMLVALRARLGEARTASVATPPRSAQAGSGPVQTVELPASGVGPTAAGSDSSAAPVHANLPAPATVTPVATAGSYFVQIGAFSDRARADALAGRLGARVDVNGALARVRLGPYPDQATADAALSRMRGEGYSDARVTR
jgi:rare lipoprotein A